MSTAGVCSISVEDEFSPLKRVIIGLGSPYQRDKEQVAREMREFPFVPDTARREQVLSLNYPSEEVLLREFEGYVDTLEKYGVEVLRPDPEVAYSFDYTCPRDIGFVIGDMFFLANMAVPSRADEIRTIQDHLDGIDPAKLVPTPEGALLEGGDVVVLDRSTVLVGINQRSNRQGYEFLRDYLAPLDYAVFAVDHRQLHLDCCLNPLGMGHMLIHVDSLDGNSEATWQALKRREWIPVDAVEREHLATNVLSIDRDRIIVRSHPACARVNRILLHLGYSIDSVEFDGVPATGGSFRCASLPLLRA